MHRVCLLFPLLGACGVAPTGVTYIGIPVDPNTATAYVDAYVRYAGGPAMPSGTIDVWSSAALEAQGAIPNESLGEHGQHFYIITDGPADCLGDWHYTTLAHELTHAIYGDPQHSRADLWGPTGLVSTWNGWVEGHNPARM